MRFLYCVALIAVLALAGCPKPKLLSTETGVAIGGGGEIPEVATIPVEMPRIGPDNPEWRWEYKMPPEAAIHKSARVAFFCFSGRTADLQSANPVAQAACLWIPWTAGLCSSSTTT